jgi:hypothetical protein
VQVDATLSRCYTRLDGIAPGSELFWDEVGDASEQVCVYNSRALFTDPRRWMNCSSKIWVEGIPTRAMSSLTLTDRPPTFELRREPRDRPKIENAVPLTFSGDSMSSA